MNRVFYGYPHKSMIPLPTSIKVVPLIIALIFSVACSELFAQSSAPPKSAKPTLPLGSALDRPVAAKPAGSSLDRTPAAKLPESLPRKPSSLGSFSDAKGMSFEAKSISNGTSEQPETVGTNISGQATKTRIRNSRNTLEILVRNLGRAEETAHLEWYFLAKDVGSGNTYVWHQDWHDFTLLPSAQSKELAESENLVTTAVRTLSYHSTGSTYSQEVVTGGRSVGWIVRMLVGDKLVKVRASNPALEQTGSDPAQMAALLKQKPPVAPSSGSPK